MRTGRTAGVLLCLVMFTLFAGCSDQISSEDIASQSRDILEDKYHQSFEIVDIEERFLGAPFATKEYLITLRKEENPECVFQATMEADNSILKDNYGKVLFGTQAESEIREVLQAYQGIKVKRSSLSYAFTDKKWDSFEKYRQAYNIALSCELELRGADEAYTLQRAYEWMECMTEMHYELNIDFSNQEVNRVVLCDAEHHLLSMEDWLDKWR